MNPREKRLAIIIGAFAGMYAVYFLVNWLYVSEIDKARKQREEFARKYNELKRLRDQKENLERVWFEDAARTFSFDETVAKDMLDLELKRIATRHGFDRPSVKNAAPLRIGYQSLIKSRATAVTLTGDYARIMAFVRDVYQSPFLCQVSSLSISPLGVRQGRNNVKLDIVVETPVLPETIKGVNFVEAPRPMSADAVESLSAFRRDFPPAEYFAVLEDRNILREFMPPPPNAVMIDNQDRKMVGVKGAFFWDGREETQFTRGVEGKKQLQIEGRGDAVEMTIAYADGTTLGPVRHEFTSPAPWSYRVASHTPAPPPQYVNLAVENAHAEEVLVNIVITTPDNKQIRPPTMLIEANKTVDLGEWEASQIQVTSRYRSEKPAPGGTYTPSESKQTLTIPPEPAEPVYVDGTPDAVVDPPPDERYTVSGLWTYRDVQEMIVTSIEGRKVISAGEPGAVDGGMLLAVHPLGGVVVMPATGNYYLYPLGRSFGRRVPLEATDESELAEAIDRWARQ